jgi:GGDEF domain-containing protein
VASQPLSPRARQELAAILAEDRPEPVVILESLRRIRDTEEAAPFAAAVETLLRVQLPEAEAERVLTGILDHRTALARALGRDPGLRVAAADYYLKLRGSARGELWEEDGEDVWDAATGLPGAHAFAAELEREIRRSRRHGLQFALVRLRCEGVLGARHARGPLLADELAKLAARTVRRALREADRACRSAELELGLLLPETDRLGARVAAERVLEALGALFAARLYDDGAAAPPLSAGAACFPEDGLTAQLLHDRAGESLQRARECGFPTVAVHPSERRAHPRTTPPAELRVRVRTAATGPVARASVVDVSRSGMLLDVPGAHRAMDRLTLELARAEATEGPAFASVGGRIVRSTPLAEPGGGLRIGVAFDEHLADGWWPASAGSRGAH